MTNWHTVQQVADRFQVKKGTIWKWVRKGMMPKPKKFGGVSRWSDGMIEQFEQGEW